MAARLHGCWTESWCHEPAVCEEEAQPRGVSRRENMAATVPPASQVEAVEKSAKEPFHRSLDVSLCSGHRMVLNFE